MIRSEHAHLLVAAKSHPGMTGKNNEDRYAISAFRLSRSIPTPSLFAVLCDGIGGHRAGEVAAEMAVDAISHKIAESNASQPLDVLKDAISSASQQIFDRAKSEDGRQGMGSTCACAWVIGNRLFITSVGDSRIYLLRGGALQQITTDHTWIQEALEVGLINRQQVPGHPNAHVIRRYLGSPTPPECDFRLRLNPTDTDEQALANQGALLLPGDKLLLCSDGLTDLVSNPEIQSVLLSQPLDAVPDSLINLANQHGGHDNITLVLFSVPEEGSANPLKKFARWVLHYWWLFLIAIATLGILGLVGVTLWLGWDLFSNPALATPILGATPVIQGTSTLLITATPPPTRQTPFPSPHSGVNVTPNGLSRSTQLPQPTTVTLTAWPTHLLPSSTPTLLKIGEGH